MPSSVYREYATISEFYGRRRARRSQVRLMRHIDEGLILLDILHASSLAKRAFCLHPIVQNNEKVDVTWSDAYALACEYRDRANAYLCIPVTDHVTTVEQARVLVGTMSKDCRDMLVADKLQNQKDFNLHHCNTHGRSNELQRYFELWLSYLTSSLWKGPSDE